MLTATLRFPLGVYYALGPGTDGADAHRTAEWPPSPVRLIGALLDAAHSRGVGASSADLALIERLAAAPAPTIEAPLAASPEDPADGRRVAMLRGPSRWAPRNLPKSEFKSLSLRDLGGTRAAVDEGGVAIGDLPVRFLWPALQLAAEEREQLSGLAADIAWLGTSRSPALVEFSEDEPAASSPRWTPMKFGSAEPAAALVRVPDANTVREFDAEFARRFSAKGKVEPSGLQKPASAGNLRGYAAPATGELTALDPRYWGEAYVLEVSTESVTLPKAPATYVVARAVRAALLAQFEGDDAPELLRGRGATPHVGVLPLPFVGSRHADGLVKGVAVWLPHPARLEGDLSGIEGVEFALGRLIERGGLVTLPRSASLTLRECIPVGSPLRTLDLARYRAPSRSWATVTPVVHSHWRTSQSKQALVDQIVADCVHVGLPAPVEIETLTQSPFSAAPTGGIDRQSVRADWRGPIDGPSTHLQLTFERPVHGPIVLGRARHFGLGLMLPAAAEEER